MNHWFLLGLGKKYNIDKIYKMIINILNILNQIKNIITKNSIYKKFFIQFITTSLSTTNIFVKAQPYEPSDFNRLKPGNLNISVYIFHDRNRNGIYDIGDKSMVGVETELIKPDGMIVNAKSNKNGYTNFKMALGSANYRHIDKDNEIYTFKVLDPTNWEITTRYKVQKIVFLKT